MSASTAAIPAVDRHAPWVWGAALIGGAAILYRFDPRGIPNLQCPFQALTGLACPGCGTLRSAHRLLHGDFFGALSFNPLLVFALPVLAALAAEQCAGRWPAFPHWEITRRLSPILPWVIISYWILRNLPCWPFLLLLPSP